MAGFEVFVSKEGVSGHDFLASDIRKISKALKEIDPDLRKQFMREAKTVGRQAESLIKPMLPTTAPLSGMNTRGRYGWNNQVGKRGTVAANKTAVAFRTATGGNTRGGTSSLVSVKVMAPMTVIADIAGRSGSWVNKGDKGSGYSKPYVDRYGNVRRHKINGQGSAMISKLGGRGSRYAWPALEHHKSQLEADVEAVVKKYVEIANRGYK